MKRALLLATALAAFLGFALPASQAEASVSVGVSIGTGHRGGFALSFSSRPNVVLIPSSRVYYAPDLDEDLYSYDDEWYYCDGDNWYSGPSYDGPFVAIAFTSVPYQIRTVPVSYRRHWGGYTGYRAPAYRAPVTNTNYRYRAPATHSYPTRTWSDRNSQNRQWNDRNSQSNDRDGQWNDRNNDHRDGNNNGRGNGRGRGNGHGNGHGRGNGRGNN